MKRESADLERRILRLTEMLADTSSPEPLLRQIETYEMRRTAIDEDIAAREAEAREVSKVRSMGYDQVARLAKELAEGCVTTDRVALRESLAVLVHQIEMDPATGQCAIRYNLTGLTGLRMASPRGNDCKTGFEWSKFPARRVA